MLNVLTRFADEDIAIAVDMKHKCMAHGWGVLTVSFLVKDKLRNTKIMGRGGRRVQARLLTSHAPPVLQAILDIEKTENIVQTFETLERLWEHVHPDEAKLSSRVKQVHKDYHAALEAARRKCYPQSRPMNDYFHLTEKFGTMQAKLLHEEVINKKTHKVNFDWVKTALAIIRHLPTPDLFSAVHRGWLQRLGQKGETLLQDYLGPQGQSIYTRRCTVANAAQEFNIKFLCMDADAEVLICPHWSGIFGMIPGTHNVRD